MARHGKFKGRPKRPPMTTPKMASPHPQRFTMQQEALNTEGHHRLWSNSNLRNKAVAFVKAGELQRSEFENVEEGEVEEKVEEKVEVEQDAHVEAEVEVEAEAEVEVAATEPEPQPMIQTPQTEITEVQKETEVEMEVQAEGKIQGEEAPEELFFFDSVGQAVDTGLPNPTISDPDQSDETSEDEVVFTGRNSKPIIIESDIQELRSIHGLQEPEIKTAAKTEELTLRSKDSRSQRKQPKQPRQRHQWSPENDDILADYIANMDQDDDSEEEEEEDKTVVQRGGIGVKHAADAGTEGDEIGVESSIDVLSKMHIDSKPDATTSDKEDSDLQINLDLDEDLNLDTPHTTDFDTDEDEDDDDDLDADILEQLALEYSRTHKKKGGRGNRNVSFPSASAFADAIDADPYYGFDIMDFDRPSLTKPSKGKRQPALELMLSDSDLEMHLQDVWQTDRKKKATKKKEREELRSQGVLGRDPDDVDLKVKYAKGMNMEELMTELRAFLMSSKQSLSLPPMTKTRRKTIHELANIVSLKSQSKGNGLTRFPILIKTSRTPGYTRKTISKVDSILSGRKLNRRLFASWGPDPSRGGGGGSAKPRARGAGGVTSGVTYMDGDVVGGSAPEIGAGNRGRAMLEKMGWSSGTALGAQNNKGILQPVTHVVKNSRAGLG